MKTGTEALASRLLSAPLPDSLIIPRGDSWPQPRADVVKHPELKMLGTRRGAAIERRIEAIVAEARTRDVPEVTIVFIAEALRAARYSDYITKRLCDLADSVDVVFFARHQTAALPSIVAHRVQSWKSPQHLDLTLDAVVREANRRFHYDVMFEKWSRGDHNLVALPYFEDDHATDGLMKRFSARFRIPIPDVTTNHKKNASLGKDQLRRLADLKRTLAGMRRIVGVRRIAAKVFYAARKKIRQEAQGPRWTLTSPERREIVALYHESNARFKGYLGSAARQKDWKRWFSELDPPRR
jgi:hypothetical protein